MIEEKRFSFVCGCPRSGTTVLTQLLNWHPQVSIGMERFGQLLQRNPQGFTPSIFDINRFFDIQNTDCFYNSFEFNAYSDWYCSKFTKSKYQGSICVGDKNPELYKYFDEVKHNFSESDFKIIFILRDINSVAESYEVRANNPNDRQWKAERNFKQAISDWNEALSALSKQLESQGSKNNLIIVNYDDLFSNYEGGKDKLPILFENLNLEFHEDICKGYQLLEQHQQKIMEAKKRRRENENKILERQRGAHPNNPTLVKIRKLDKEYIATHALLDTYHSLKEQCI
ncbi:MAG: hypothetical protein Tsb0014_15980 [Pleurocapsa sp.]